MIAKELQKERKKKLGLLSHSFSFSKIEHETADFHSLGTAKKGENYTTLSILDAAFC